jgi:hypothetical protein
MILNLTETAEKLEFMLIHFRSKLYIGSRRMENVSYCRWSLGGHSWMKLHTMKSEAPVSCSGCSFLWGKCLLNKFDIGPEFLSKKLLLTHVKDKAAK